MSGDSGDDLDKLLNQYEAEAAASTEAVLAKQRGAAAGRKGMEARREDGLAAPLQHDNRGFQLLANMGYRAGEGIGAGRQGRIEPLAVDTKSSRAGLGIDEDRRRRKERALSQRVETDAKRARVEVEAHSSFKRAQAVTFSSRQAERNLHRGRKVVETLDEREAVPRHDMWLPEPPAASADEDGAEDEEEQLDPEAWELQPAESKLAEVLLYLRRRHLYCLYCACQFSSVDDMGASCPGVHEDDH